MGVKPGYKRTEVGVIPEEWEVIPLGAVAQFRTGPFGSALHKSDYTTDGIPVINPMHIIDGELSPSTQMSITEVAAQQLSEFRLKAGEVVLGRRGDMGRCALVQRQHEGWLCGTGSMIVRPGSAVDPGFLSRILSSPSVVASIEEASVGSTMINLNQGTLRSLLVQLPPVAEQRAIATALSDVDALLTQLDRLIAKKRDIKQAAMQQLLTGKTRLPGFDVEWRTVSFGDIARPRGSRIDPRRQGAQSFCIELEHLESGTGRLAGSTVASESASLKTVFQVGDVLFGKLRAYLRKFWLADRPGICSTEIWALEPSATVTTSGYLVQIVMGDPFIEAASNAHGTHMPRSDWHVVKNLEVLLPPIEEQTAIATLLSDLDAELAALEARRDKTRALKQGMMQELLTGRTRLV